MTTKNQENKFIASLVRELVIDALEVREDLYLSKIAEKLDKNDAHTYSHHEAWK